MTPSRRLLQLCFSRRNYGTGRDRDLINALRAELKHEQSSNHFQKHQSGSSGDLVLDWDNPQSQDIVLRRKYGAGEEIAISALLGPESFEEEGTLPRKVLMKICMRKRNSSPILLFDCTIFSRGADGSDFDIQNAFYLHSSGCLGAAYYKGPMFSSLDPELQKSFKEYLIARGISEELTTFLLLHLHKKEQSQYVNWLKRLESMIEKDV